MNWLNLQVSVIRAPEYVGSEPVQRATWLNVLAYSAEHENGGRIAGARKWKDRQWQQTCGVTLAEVEAAGELLTWDGEDLAVWNYPDEKEEEVRTRRELGRSTSERKAEAARRNGKLGGRPKTEQPEENNPTKEPTETHSEPIEGKGKEGEGKGKELPPSPQGGQAASPPGASKKGFTEGKDSALLPTTPQSLRVAAIYHRKSSTPWDEKEVRAYKKIGVVPEEDLAAVERYYAAHWPPCREVNILRHDLATFLNNFQGEVGRGHAYAASVTAPEVKEFEEI